MPQVSDVAFLCIQSLLLSDNQTLSIDVSRSWTNATVTINTIDKTVPSWNSAYLWPDASRASFYQWGGQQSRLRLSRDSVGVASALYKFQPGNHSGGEWTVHGPTLPSNSQNFRRGWGGAAASKGDTWYMVGGITTCVSDPKVEECGQFHPLGPMISCNSTSNLWTKDSVQDFTASRTAF